jgi:hypothetical protein
MLNLEGVIWTFSIFSKITYDVLCHITKVDIKIQLIREKIKITNHVKR